MDFGFERGLSTITLSRALVLSALLIVVLASSTVIPPGVDWRSHLRPATRAFLRLESPYRAGAVFNPPWVFLLLTPIALLPEQAGGAILFWMAFATWAYFSWRLSEGSLAVVLAVVTSPMVVNGLLVGNLDFLVVWGLVLPAELAVFFLALKPQVGGAVLVLLAWQLYREGGWRRLARVFIPPFVFTVLSFVAYGPWPLHAGDAISRSWNASPFVILGWPSIIIGIGLLAVAATRKESEDANKIAMAASPFFSPYVGFQSWVAFLPALMNTKALYALWIVLWGWFAYVAVR
ncbi:MAG: hypothetical protein ACP5JJ_20000 [Anaerolineae bacterium]